MEQLYCPKCGKELNGYEINNKWCTSCNYKFKTKEELQELNKVIKREKEQKNNYMITTGNIFQGYCIERYIDVISCEVVLGTGFMSELSAKVNDVFGTESRKFANKIKEAKEIVREQYIEEAIKLESNATIGFKYEMNNLSDNIIVVSAYGTAVVISKMDENV